MGPQHPDEIDLVHPASGAQERHALLGLTLLGSSSPALLYPSASRSLSDPHVGMRVPMYGFESSAVGWTHFL